MIYTGVESKNKVYLRNITERKRVTSLIQTRVAHNVNEFHFLYGFKSRAFLLFFFSFCLLLLLCFCLFCCVFLSSLWNRLFTLYWGFFLCIYFQKYLSLAYILLITFIVQWKPQVTLNLGLGFGVWAYANGEEIILYRWKVLNVAQKSHNNIFLEYLNH